jgi:nicotinamide-nucleotide amidase
MIDDILDRLSENCIKQDLKIATAESCTGGLVAKLITDRAGSSKWFECGFVTYSNRAKQQMLGVDLNLLENRGAVSEQVAGMMAVGVLGNSVADIVCSITGIAGPQGGSEEKPVGTVCFGWVSRQTQRPVMITEHFIGDRGSVREQAAEFALQGLLKLVRQTRK